MASHQDVDLQIFLGATSEKKTLENRERFPSLSFIAPPRSATRDVPGGDETEAPQAVASDYVAIANSEVVEPIRLPFTPKEALRIPSPVSSGPL
jgi:hypothetical protein